MNERSHRHGVPIPPATRDRLRALVERLGEYEAAKVVGVGYPCVLRAIIGLGVRRGTARAIEFAVGATQDDGQQMPGA